MAGKILIVDDEAYARDKLRRLVAENTVDTVVSEARDGKEALECTAFTNPDGSTAIVVMNRSLTAISFELRIDGLHCITELPARAIATYCVEDFA